MSTEGQGRRAAAELVHRHRHDVHGVTSDRTPRPRACPGGSGPAPRAAPFTDRWRGPARARTALMTDALLSRPPRRLHDPDPARRVAGLLRAGAYRAGRSARLGAAAGRLRRPAERMLRALYGFDRPYAEQFAHWLWRALHGDLGTSIATGRAGDRRRSSRRSATRSRLAAARDLRSASSSARCSASSPAITAAPGIDKLASALSRCSASACRITGSAWCW